MQDNNRKVMGEIFLAFFICGRRERPYFSGTQRLLGRGHFSTWNHSVFGRFGENRQVAEAVEDC
jgi:hypothetical protein